MYSVGLGSWKTRKGTRIYHLYNTGVVPIEKTIIKLQLKKRKFIPPEIVLEIMIKMANSIIPPSQGSTDYRDDKTSSLILVQ